MHRKHKSRRIQVSSGSADGLVIQVDLSEEHISATVSEFQDVVVVIKITVDDGVWCCGVPHTCT